VGSVAVREAHEFLMSADHWKNFQSLPDAYQIPAPVADRARNLKALRRLWEHDDRVARCVIHGDAHLGNTCISPDGRPYFIDWAGPCKSSWAFDVSYFIVGAMTVADRRASEIDLLRGYVDRLAAFGGPALDWDDAWTEYRRHHLPGLVWATLPSSMQSVENVHAMGSRYAAAIQDHDVLSLLER
jgi:aminoglycoside phosphotransferase (APT) family kinase protein